jgi:hypothetical protein
MAVSSADATRSTAARYGPRKGPAVDSAVAMSTDHDYSRAAAWRAASSATSFCWYTATAAASAHASYSA